MVNPQRRGDAAQRSSLALLLGSLGVAGLSSGSLATARFILPTFALAIGAGVAFSGTLGSFLTIVSIFLSHRFGGWVDKVGPRLPVIVALAMITAAPLAYILYPDSRMLIATAMLAGTGGMFAHIASAKAVGEAGLPSERTRNLGYLVLIYSIGQFVCPVIAGWTLQNVAPIAGLSIICMFSVLALTALVVLPHNFTATPRAVTQVNPYEKMGMFSLLSSPVFRIWLMCSVGFITVQSLYPFVIALHANQIGLSPARAGIVLGYYAAGTFLSRLATPFAMRFLRAEWLIAAGLIVGSAEYAFIPFARDFAPLAIASGLLGLTLGIGVPLTLGLLYTTAPKGHENAGVGLNTAIANLLQTVLPLVLAFTTAGFGVGPMLWALSAAMIALGATIALRKF